MYFCFVFCRNYRIIYGLLGMKIKFLKNTYIQLQNKVLTFLYSFFLEKAPSKRMPTAFRFVKKLFYFKIVMLEIFSLT